jgi:hypothetical protein
MLLFTKSFNVTNCRNYISLQNDSKSEKYPLDECVVVVSLIL